MKNDINTGKSVKSGKRPMGIIAVISAVVCYCMLAFPIVAGTVRETVNFGYGITNSYKVFKMCCGFDTLIFNSASERLMDDSYIIVGVINWFITIFSAILIIFSIISLAKFREKPSRTISFLVLVFGIILGFIYTLEGIISVVVWGGDKYTLAFIPLLVQEALLIALICINKKYPVIESEEEKQMDGSGFKGFYPLTNHILLMLFVPFWSFVWIYRITGYLNCVENEPKRDPAKKLLLCMFVPFYTVYWTYKSAQSIDKLAKMRGVSSDLTTLCLVLSIFIGIIPPILMQQKINEVETSENNDEIKTAGSARSIDVAEEIKKFKELFDMGAITEEEYNEQKAQLLQK